MHFWKRNVKGRNAIVFRTVLVNKTLSHGYSKLEISNYAIGITLSVRAVNLHMKD